MINLSQALITEHSKWTKRHGKVILLHDSAPIHITKVVKKFLNELNWDMLSHPLYSQDIASFNYHLFQLMGNVLAEQKFANIEERKKWVHSWFSLKDESLYSHGIYILLGKLKKNCAIEWRMLQINGSNHSLQINVFFLKSTFNRYTSNMYVCSTLNSHGEYHFTKWWFGNNLLNFFNL